MNNIHYRVADFRGDFHKGIVDLRYAVYVDEQKVPVELEIDEYDNNAVHYVALFEKRVIGTCRHLVKGNTLKVGRLAVEAKFREMGVATKLMQMTIRFAKRNGLENLEVDSQVKAMPFYKRLGFIAHGEIFDDAGIDHKKMTLDISTK